MIPKLLDPSSLLVFPPHFAGLCELWWFEKLYCKQGCMVFTPAQLSILLGSTCLCDLGHPGCSRH